MAETKAHRRLRESGNIVLWNSKQPVPQKEVQEEVVRALEILLDDAKKGGLIGFIYITSYNDGVHGRGSIGAYGRDSVLGQMETMKYEVIKADLDE